MMVLSRRLWSPLTTVEEGGDRAVPVVDHVRMNPVSRLLPVVGQFVVVRDALNVHTFPGKVGDLFIQNINVECRNVTAARSAGL